MMSTVVAVLSVALLLRSSLALAPGAVQQVVNLPQCATVSTASLSLNAANHTLLANSSTVHWGYFYSALEPAAVVNSGDEIFVEMVTHHAGDDPAKMIIGDPGMEDIYRWNKDGDIGVPQRGANGNGDGVHVLTGPIYVCGAEAGDVLQVDILDLAPRVNPATGKSYGSNAAANWGYQFKAGFLDGIRREVITIYEIIRDAAGGLLWALPDYQFRYGKYPEAMAQYTGPTTNCTLDAGMLEGAAKGENILWTNLNRTYSGANVPCINGTQQWSFYAYPGLLTQHPTGDEDTSIRGKFKVPINLHIGNIGVASAYNKTIDSVPPSIHGGNVDDRRTGIGATLYYPVQVAGAMLSMGDAHTSQGDSELDGTGIETSINGRFKLTLHKKAALPKLVQNLTFPLLENANEYVVHGFTFADYLKELDDPTTVYAKSSLDKAMTVTYNQTRDFVMHAFDLTEDQAITAITVGMDFGITQVVDGNYGIHCVIPKWMFANSTTPYMPVTMAGTSKPADCKLLTTL
ncbi:hypothetical protein WJX72_010706 [[Myrmecia] bisecta]|uniref:Acetamidase n=1 Tax=[Myrmecia] bisecta TaxID=41462 RepID=A0AAW1PQ92_9CHLO